MLRPWQAYQKLFYGDLKAKIETEWQEFKRANPDSAMTQFQFCNDKMRLWYDESSPEVKQQVEEYRQKKKSGLGEVGEQDSQNCDLQNRNFQE